MVALETQTYKNDIERLLVEGERGIDIAEDVPEIATLVLELLARRLDVAELESRVTANESANLERLLVVVEEFRDVDRELALPDGRKLDAAHLVKDLAEVLHIHKAQADTLGVKLLLATLIGRDFDNLLMAAQGSDAVPKFETRMEEILRGFSDDDVVSLWSATCREFASDWDEAYDSSTAPLPAGFFDPGSAEQLRPRLAAYFARIRPDLMWGRIAASQAFPDCVPSAALVVASRTLKSVTATERRIMRCLHRIYAAWGVNNPVIFATALAIPRESRFARMEEQRRHIGRKPSSVGDDELVLRASLRLLDYADAIVDMQGRVERALRAYKLGLEVHHEPANDWCEVQREWGELRLQRHACRFMVEHDVRAFGTQFGSSELDLLIGQLPDWIALEAKRYTEDSDWNNLGKHLGQLVRYLDEERFAERGVLLIYNFSRVVLLSEPRWIRRRYWILPINLCPETPSKSRKVVTVEEEDGDSLVKLVRNF